MASDIVCDFLFMSDDNPLNVDIENIGWFLEQLDQHVNTPTADITHSTIQYPQCFEWCGRTGKRKLQPFWVYCEESQKNFVKFNMYTPHINPTPKSKLARSLINDTQLNSYILVENHELEKTRVCSISNLDLPPLFYEQNQYEIIPTDDINWKIKLISDNENPVHPQQGNASSINMDITRLDFAVPDLFEFPLGMFFQINIKGRIQGFFKLEFILYHEDTPIFKTYSDTFMMNDTRMKRVKEHRLYSCKELKFMRLFALENQKNNFVDIPAWEELGKELNFKNTSKLLKEATNLFPKAARRKSPSVKNKK
mmetsp:Transcript_36092/g.61949  ORF Transcript_36092/g.61949 Transcript_36092/m.61949 type:complete len:310 (-) Transcript_36092:2-931(-)